MAKDAEGKEIVEGGDKGEAKLTQAQVDAIVQDRLAREKAKYTDYDELKKFRTEFEKSQDAKQLQLLEEQNKYKEAKDSYEKKISEYQGVVSKKDSELQDMKITHALTGEVFKQNAYAEETLALIKPQVIVDKDGNISIKGKDANGMDKTYSIEEGIKNFLTQRPHLVKASQKNGGGTPPNNSGGGDKGGDDLVSLTNQYQSALNRGDRKLANELNIKLKAAIAAKRAGA